MAALSNADIEQILVPPEELNHLFLMDGKRICIPNRRPIEDLLDNGRLVIFPPVQPDQIGSWTVDIHLSSRLYEPRPPSKVAYHGRDSVHFVNPTIDFREGKPNWKDNFIRHDTGEAATAETDPKKIDYVLRPGEFVLGVSLQFIGIPITLGAELSGLSSNGRFGITAQVDADVFDAGFAGWPVFEISNVGYQQFSLHCGLKIAQFKFYELKTPTTKPHYKKVSQFAWQMP